MGTCPRGTSARSRPCNTVSRPCGLSSPYSTSSSVVVSSLPPLSPRLSPLPLSPALFFPYWCLPLSLFLSSHTGLLRPLLLVFYGASAFNQDLSSWNVGEVTNMYNMFRDASAFNQDLSSWNVGKVTTMQFMFYRASAFNQDLSSWNVGKVTSMSYMFNGASAFNQTLCGIEWVASTAYSETQRESLHISDSLCDDAPANILPHRNALQTALFGCVGACGGSLWGSGARAYCYYGDGGPWASGTGAECDAGSTHGAIDTWDVSRVTTMYHIFASASVFDQDLSSWNVGKVTDMSGSESSVRSLLLPLLLVGRGVLSSVYTSLSSPSLSCGVLPLLVSSPSLSSSHTGLLPSSS